MQQDQGSRSCGHLGRGVLYSLLLHAALLMPIGIVAFVLGAREAAQRAEEVDVGFESVPDSQLPENLPPLEPPKTAEQDALEKLKPEAQKPPPQPKKKPLDEPLAKKDEPKPKPEPEVVAPPMPPMPEAAKPPPPPEPNKKSVEVEN